MEVSFDFNSEFSARFAEYCRRRRDERGGRAIQSATAIRELLEKALSGIEPERPLTERITDLERRVAALEVTDARPT